MEYLDIRELEEEEKSYYVAAVEAVDRRTNDYQPSGDQWYYSTKEEAVAKYKSIDLEWWYRRQCKADRDKHYLTKSVSFVEGNDCDTLLLEYAGREDE